MSEERDKRPATVEQVPSDAEGIVTKVRERYGRIAREDRTGCCSVPGPELQSDVARELGYEVGELESAPGGANLGLGCTHDVEVLHLEEALTRLGELHERTAKVVELRIFGGLKITEIAHVLSLSRQTIQDDWRVAKMWLCREFAGDRAP